MIASRGSVSGVGKVVGAFGRSEDWEQRSDPPPCRFDGSFRSLSEQCFEFCEDLLDGIEVRAVRRQEEQLGAGGADSASHGLSFVTAEIVDDDDVAGLAMFHLAAAG